MRRAIELAEKGRGTTRPNPLVGAVIVNDGQVVGEGFNRRVGGDHAEIVALKNARGSVRGATIYVSLEPCCHTGHTGPCCEALIEAGISRVVIPTIDPNPIVNGRGVRRLRKAGIRVDTGVLRHEAEKLNDMYFGRHKGGRPYVIVKVAQSLDGRIATSNGNSQWITQQEARVIGHRLRAEVDAVIVGGGTVRADNPALTVRHVKGQNPYRIVVTSSGDLPSSCKLVSENDDYRTILAAPVKTVERLSKVKRNRGVIFWSVKTSKSGLLDLTDLLVSASKFGIGTMLVEGGSQLAGSFLRSGLVDKYVAFVAPMILGEGIPAVSDLHPRKIDDGIRLVDVTTERVGADVMISGYIKYGN